ncbi:migration and invasion enhancer 1-like [Amphiura filiformis]|uniref:migration and invasion enhancer 1-like n=1 Tax=Amphiura filiformis TaxID=82378 RepID=UPI003B214845
MESRKERRMEGKRMDGRKEGYYPRYLELAEDIKAADPDAVVAGKVGRSSSFEITLNNQLLFSKLKTHGFPDNTEIIANIKNYSGEGNVEPVTNVEAGSWCIIL